MCIEAALTAPSGGSVQPGPINNEPFDQSITSRRSASRRGCVVLEQYYAAARVLIQAVAASCPQVVGKLAVWASLRNS